MVLSLLSLAACGGGGSDPVAGTPAPSQPAIPAPGPAPAPVAPVIAAQPASVKVASGAAATFSVGAGTDATQQYQWLRNGVPVPQAVQPSLTVTAAPAEDGAIYRVVVKNAAGEARSEAAALRLTGVAQYKVIGAIDEAFLIAQSWPYSDVLPRSSMTEGFVDGAASLARFTTTADVAADIAGNLYVADLGNGAVRKVSPSGVVSTLARGLTPVTTYSPNYLRVGHMILSAGLDGSVYAVDKNGVVSINANGVMTRVETPTYTDWYAGRVYKTHVVAIAVDRTGNRYELIEEVAMSYGCSSSTGCGDMLRRTLHRVGADGKTRDWRGGDVPINPNDINDWVPIALAIDAAGTLYLSESMSNAIWTLTPGGEWSLFSNARQNAALALAVDAQGNVYALDKADGLASIRRITPDGKVTVLTGDATTPRLFAAASALPPAIAIDADNRLWVTQGDGVVQLDHR